VRESCKAPRKGGEKSLKPAGQVRYAIIIAAASLPLILAALHVTHAEESIAPGTV